MKRPMNPSPGMWYYFHDSMNNYSGPISTNILMHMYDTKEIPHKTYVWSTVTGEWLAISDVLSFISHNVCEQTLTVNSDSQANTSKATSANVTDVCKYNKEAPAQTKEPVSIDSQTLPSRSKVLLVTLLVIVFGTLLGAYLLMHVSSMLPGPLVHNDRDHSITSFCCGKAVQG